MNEESLFNLVVGVGDAERAALLDQHCGDNPELRRRVEQLVEAYLARETAGIAATEMHELAADDAEPATDGHREESEGDLTGTVLAEKYTLLEVIGQGGMGSVWLASQSTPVKRKVAIKLIKAGMDSRAVLARFEQERQALAIMDHPNIAKVLDGGLMPGGQPYFVMELVKGLPITEYCDRMKLSPEKRLELFIPVCNAIQHAHQKGIIHRDIKPSNVLVALFDDTPVPKVIDFGVAKATGASLSEQTIHTAFGGVVGTPQYMSPEQATLNNLDIDTRSDVYSLGVLLYELLTGSPPFSDQELEKIGVLEILRFVREEDPPRPSVKLSSSQTLPALSANRSTDPGKLTHLLRSELDWIVLRALEKERSRRYETAQSFVAGDQVLAHPPTLGYRFRKFAKKHRGLLTAGTLVTAALLAGIVGTSWQMFRANREAERANNEMRNAQDEMRNAQVARDDAEIARDEAQVARDEAETALINGILRPLGYSSRGIDQSELVSFQDLAYLATDRIKLRTVESCLEDPALAARVYPRIERLLQACVGISLERRENVIRLCLAKVRDTDLDPSIRGLAMLSLVELVAHEELSLPTAIEIAAKLPESRQKSAWQSIAAAYSRPDPKGWLEMCWQILERGESFAPLASQAIIEKAAIDSAFAAKALDRIRSVLAADHQENASPKQTNHQKSWGLLMSTYNQLNTSLYKDSPDERIENSWNLCFAINWKDAAVEGLSTDTVETILIDFLEALSNADDERFATGMALLKTIPVETLRGGLTEVLGEIAERRVGRGYNGTDYEFIYTIPPKLSPEQSAWWYEFFLRLPVSEDHSIFNGYAIRGVVLRELGLHLRSDEPDRFFRRLISRREDQSEAFGKDPANEAANYLQAIAGLMRSPDFTRHEEATQHIIELANTPMADFAVNAGWLAIGESAGELKPEMIKKANDAILGNLRFPGDYDAGTSNTEETGDTSVHALALHQLKQVDSDLETDLRRAFQTSMDIWLASEGRNNRQSTFLSGLLDVAPESFASDMTHQFLAGLPNWADINLDLSEEASPLMLRMFASMNQEQRRELINLIVQRVGEDVKWLGFGAGTSDFVAKDLLLRLVDELDGDEMRLLFDSLYERLEMTQHIDPTTRNTDATRWAILEVLSKLVSQNEAFDQSALLTEVAQGMRNCEGDIKTLQGYLDLLVQADLSVDRLPLDLLREIWRTRTVERFMEVATSDAQKVRDTRGEIWDPCLVVTLARKETDLAALIGDIEQHVKNCETIHVFDFFVELVSEAKIELNASTVDMMARKANELFRESPVEWNRLISFVNDRTLLAAELAKPTCIGSYRDAILHRLEQLASPETLQNSPENAIWDPELYAADLAKPRTKFQTIADFVRWDQQRAAANPAASVKSE